MEIIKRIKRNGQVIKYVVIDGNRNYELDAQTVIGMSAMITNAVLVNGVDYRAKAGCHIETVQVHDIGIQMSNQLAKVNVSNVSGIDYHGKEFISVCRKIRNYAVSGRVEVEKRRHVSNDGQNVNMFKMIEACGISVDDFVCGYLSVLQPYSLQRFMKEKDIGANNIWFCDVGYRIKMVIKINESNKNKPVVVSFHESNIRGNYVHAGVDFSDKLCAVFVDKVEDVGDYFSVDYTVQRGFLRHGIHSQSGYFSNGVALIEYKYIKSRFTETMQYVFDSLYRVYGDSQSEFVLKDLNVGKLSFMSEGYGTVNNICYLIDLYENYTDVKSRAVFIDVVLNLIDEISDLRLLEIRTALKEKFGNFDNKLYRAVLEG